jgi:hypothetical protein
MNETLIEIQTAIDKNENEVKSDEVYFKIFVFVLITGIYQNMTNLKDK